jgi:hemin uptake protein HemP
MKSAAQPSRDRTASTTTEPRELPSRELFDGANEILILHEDARYRLRITRQNKLILTK